MEKETKKEKTNTGKNITTISIAQTMQNYEAKILELKKALDSIKSLKEELDAVDKILAETEADNKILRNELLLSNNTNLKLIAENTKLNNIIKCLENRVTNLHRLSISKIEYADISRRLTDTLDINKSMLKSLEKYNKSFWRRLLINKLKF